MKHSVIIVFILGLGALTSYWGITSEKMAKSVTESQLSGQLPAPVKPSGKLLIMSDIHFNPFCDLTLIKSLCASDYTKWKGIFESSADSSYGKYSSDTYYRLFKSTMKAMRLRNSKPDMIIINGDFLCHDFQSNYAMYTGIQNPDSMQSFLRKTINFVCMMLRENFPGTPVLPVLGNNDDYCGDYNIQPSGAFLKFFSANVQPMLYKFQSRDFTKTFSRGGYYQASMPWDSNQVFIGINSVFFSSNYYNACNPGDTVDAGREQLQWLSQTLAQCAAKGKKVWLSCHIPPGINVYSSSGGSGPCTKPTATMWKNTYNQQYLALINKYSRIIMAGMAGHTHMDDFRVLGTDSTPTSFIHITPAVSPIFGNNPAFQEITWDPRAMRFLNSVTYRFNGIQTSGKNNWNEEYNYAKTYGITSMNAQTLNSVWKKTDTDSVARNKYLKYYYVGSEMSPSPWKAYWCGIRWQTPETFRKCNCQ